MNRVARYRVNDNLASRTHLAPSQGMSRYLLSGAAQTLLIEECIRTENSFKSFVAPDKLADCLRSLIEGPWDKISETLGAPTTSLKAKLKAVVDLRNRIAHEADVNPGYGGIELWPIYSQDVDESISFLRSLGRSIAEVLVNI